MLYSENDLIELAEQKKKRIRMLILLSVIAAAGTAASFIVRIEWLTVLLTILLGTVWIAGWQLFVRPIQDESAHIDHILHGRTHETTGRFVVLDDAVSLIDGVRYHALHMEQDEPNELEPVERLFYFDADRSFPTDIAPGDLIYVLYHDREIGAIRKLY